MAKVKQTHPDEHDKVVLIAPLKEMHAPSPGGYYGLMITDVYGKTHYFNHDGSYDGWSTEIRYESPCRG